MEVKVIFLILCGKLPNSLINRYTITVLVLTLIPIPGYNDFGANFFPQVLLPKLPYSLFIIYHQGLNETCGDVNI